MTTKTRKTSTPQVTQTHPTFCTSARVLSLVGGLGAGALGCYGAYEYAVKLDGFSYLAVAAPLVAAAAAFLPPLAEHAWQARQYLKAIVLALILLPAALTVFFSAAERVHHAKAGAEAERLATRTAVARAEANLNDVKASAKTATAAADKVRGLNEKTCGPKCQSIRASETAATGRVALAETALRTAQGQATTEASLTPPVWLLPAALDLVAFGLIWAAFGTSAKVQPTTPAKPKQKRKTKPKTKPSPAAPAIKVAAIKLVASR
jgi:hypothetical protein